MVYIELFHGRKTPTEEMDDWGEPGPVFGPLAHVHTTYVHDIKLGTSKEDLGSLHVVNDLVYYDGMYYGDWSVFGVEELDQSLRERLIQFEESNALPPGTTYLNGWRMIPTEA